MFPTVTAMGACSRLALQGLYSILMEAELRACACIRQGNSRMSDRKDRWPGWEPQVLWTYSHT